MKLWRLFIVLIEGARFYNKIRPRWRLLPSRDFLRWRLGTVYGSFDQATGGPRKIRHLLRDLWRDRAKAAEFLLWCRQMRLAEKRKRLR